MAMGEAYPIGGNKHGSYLTGWSLGAFEINLINVSYLHLLPVFSSMSQRIYD